MENIETHGRDLVDNLGNLKKETYIAKFTTDLNHWDIPEIPRMNALLDEQSSKLIGFLRAIDQHVNILRTEMRTENDQLREDIRQLRAEFADMQRQSNEMMGNIST